MTAHSSPAARQRYFTTPRIVLWALFLFGLVAIVLRYIGGMGAISHMNNSFSFGLWISLDLLCGVVTAAGAFTICAATYMLNIQEFHPLVRPSVLTGFLGYVLVILALLVDVARPERLWQMLIYWNPHSPLFEVGLCVMTYTFVLLCEFSPVFFEHLNWQVPLKIMKSISMFFVILGVVLSTLHQSSLGSLFLVMADKVHPLWHSPLLPLFFFISAATVGLAMVIFESTVSARSYGRKPETHLLGKLSKAIPWMLGLYLALKIGELVISGDWPLLFSTAWPVPLFWVEMLVGVILPGILFALPAVRKSQRWLFTGASLVIAGLMLNRFDVGLVTWKRPDGVSYFPHILEFAVSFGIIAAGVLVYDWIARNMALFEDEHHEKAA